MSQKINIIAVVNEPTEVAFDKLHKVLSDFGYYIASYNPKSGLVEFSAWVYKVSTMCRQTDNQRTEITFVCEHSASSEINKHGCYQLIENISKAYNDKSDKSKSLVVQFVDEDMPQNIAYDTNSYNMQSSNENEFRAIFIGLLLVIVGIISILFATGSFSNIISSSSYRFQSNSSSSSYSQSSSSSSSNSQSNSNRYSPNPGNRYSWLRGYWQCATPYGSMMLLIDGKGRISSRDEGGNIEAGSYTVDAENNQLRVHFDKEPEWLITTYKLQNQQIYFGSGLWYYKFAPY